MSKNGVTKRGRPRKYKSGAERQRAYRKRRAEGIHRKFFHHHRKSDPNRIINVTVSNVKAMLSKDSTIDLIRNCKKEKVLDRAQLPEWIASLYESRRDLNRVIRFLKKL